MNNQFSKSDRTDQGEAGNGNETAIVKQAPIEERAVTYAPFQSTEKITLTAGMVIKFLCKPTKRGFTCSAEHAVRFMMLCKARALNPWEGDAFLVGYDGSDGPEFNLITSHQAFLKRAEAHGAFEGMESGVMLIDNEDVITEQQGDFIPPGFDLVGGWAKVYRSDRKIPCYRRLNLNTFNKGYSQWKANPQGMIVKVAEADALRSSFPNSLAGMYLEGEIEPRKVESQVQATVTDGASRTEEMVKRLKNKSAKEHIARIMDQETPSDPEPSQAPAEAAPVAQEAPQQQEQTKEEEKKEKIQIKEPVDLTDHHKWIDFMLEAAQDLKVDEKVINEWVLNRFTPAIFTSKSLQNKTTAAARRKAFQDFVREHGGEPVPVQR